MSPVAFYCFLSVHGAPSCLAEIAPENSVPDSQKLLSKVKILCLKQLIPYSNEDFRQPALSHGQRSAAILSLVASLMIFSSEAQKYQLTSSGHMKNWCCSKRRCLGK